MVLHKCPECGQKFGVMPNLTRHRKTHSEKMFRCEKRGERFTLIQGLDRHSKQHAYPNIPVYRAGEAQMKNTEKGNQIWNLAQDEEVADKLWWDPKAAEKEARQCGHELWRSEVRITFGRCEGQTFRWLLENVVGYSLWLVYQFIQSGESNPSMRWQKEQLLELVNGYPILIKELDIRKNVRPFLFILKP